MKKHNMLEDVNLNEFIDEYVKNSVKFIKRLQEMGYPVHYEFNDDLTYTVLKQLMNTFEFTTYTDNGYSFLIVSDKPCHSFSYRTRITNDLKNALEKWVERYE